MIDCPGVSGANDLATSSSWGPATLWMMPEIPLPASREGLAEITNISELIFKIFSKTSLTITLCVIPDNLLITKYPGIDAETWYHLTLTIET